MRILTIIHELPPHAGGAGIAAMTLANELSREHVIDIVAPRYPGQPREERSGNVTIHRVWTLGGPHAESRGKLGPVFSFASFVASALLRGTALLVRNRYSLIHSHFVIPAGFVGRVLSLFSGLPHVVTVVEADVLDPYTSCTKPYRNPAIRSVISGVIRSSAASVAISTYIKNATERAYPVPAKLKVISYGAALPGARAAAVRAQFGFAADDTICVSVGRLVRRKGYDFLIQAAAAIPDNRFKFVIVGNGPDLAALNETIRAHGLADRVRIFTGCDDTAKFQILSISDLFVLPSLHEGYGIVILEAMLCGLPVIATSIGGQADIVNEGENGLFVPPGDAPALAAGIRKLAGDPALRKSMSENNVRRAALFSHARAAAQYAELFDSVRVRR